MPRRDLTEDALARQQRALGRLEGQFARLDAELDALEERMVRAGWLDDGQTAEENELRDEHDNSPAPSRRRRGRRKPR